MLIKKELQNLPLSPSPAPAKRVPLTAGAAVHRLPRCGDILAVDVYKNRKLIFRFFSDGKNFITRMEQFSSWTKRNPFIAGSIRGHSISASANSIENISRILGDGPCIWDVSDHIEKFISRWYSKKKGKALEAKYRLMERHLDNVTFQWPADVLLCCSG